MRNPVKTPNFFGFESFGVKIGIKSNEAGLFQEIIRKLPEIIPYKYFSEYNSVTDHNFLLEKGEQKIRLFKDTEYLDESESQENILNYFFGRLRLTIAEFAVGKVFLHAGAISWKGKAIIFPGNSFSGKTTLVAELIKNGATYYSDEYAVLDENGLNYPFPKTLSIRGITDEYKQFEVAPESFECEIGNNPVPVAMILIGQFEKDAKWNPEILSPGNGVLEIIPHTIPIRFNPKFSLQVLNNISKRAIIAKSKRGEAREVVNFVLKFFETEAI